MVLVLVPQIRKGIFIMPEIIENSGNRGIQSLYKFIICALA